MIETQALHAVVREDGKPRALRLSPLWRRGEDINFVPAKFRNTYRHWMTNIKDWCISRQLWWGHRIPAWFLPEGGYVVAENEQEALLKAIEKTGNASLTLSPTFSSGSRLSRHMVRAGSGRYPCSTESLEPEKQ